MDITRENFKDVYPIIKEKLRTCVFYSIDEEMTGINSSSPQHRNRKDDTPEARYLKMLPVASKYSIIQFGLCFFHDDGNGGFIASPYNIYLFPNSGRDLVMSSSSIDFLRKNGMDFGTWIGKGITFVDDKQELTLRQKLAEENNGETRSQIILSKQSDIDLIEHEMNGVAQMLASDTETTHVFGDTNGFLRRVIYEQTALRFPNLVSVGKNQDQKLQATKVSLVEKAKFDEDKLRNQQNNLFDTLGFRNLFNDMVLSGKPLVGHNLFFDLLFLTTWLHGAPPDTLAKYKEFLNVAFPSIYDTKYLASSGILGVESTPESTSLEDCCKFFPSNLKLNNGNSTIENQIEESNINISISDEMSSIDITSQFHNAGYDAFMTGRVFAAQLFKIVNSFVSTNVSSNNASTYFQHEVLSDTKNKVFMMRSLFHMNLNADEESDILKYDGVLVHVTNFEKSLKTDDIIEVCYSGGFDKKDVEVIWIDDLAFVIRLSNCSREMLDNVKFPVAWKIQSVEHALYPSMDDSAEELEEEKDDQVEEVQNQKVGETKDTAAAEEEENERKRRRVNEGNGGGCCIC